MRNLKRKTGVLKQYEAIDNSASEDLLTKAKTDAEVFEKDFKKVKAMCSCMKSFVGKSSNSN